MMMTAAVAAEVNLHVDHVMMMAGMVAADKVDGLEIPKDIRKQQNADGKAVVVAEAEAPAAAAEAPAEAVRIMTMTIAEDAVVGSEIRKGIQKLQNADGKAVDQEGVLLPAMMMMIMMIAEEAAAEAAHPAMMMMMIAEADAETEEEDGLEILKDTQKLLKEAGKAVAVEVEEAQVVEEVQAVEEAAGTMMMIAMDAVAEVDVQTAAAAEDGSEIPKVILKQLSAAGIDVNFSVR